MPKLAVPLAAIAIASAVPAGGAARAATLGPHAAACREGAGPAMLVHVVGLKHRRGTVRVQSYGGDPATFLDKGGYLERVDVAPPAQGAIDVCMPLPSAGTYAVSVRHLAGSTSEMEDGGGLSGNPRRTLMDLMFKRKPAPDEIAVRVVGVVTVPVIMNYVQGGSFKPVGTGER